MKALLALGVFFAALLWPLQASPIDLDSYCHGWCQARYQDGIYKNGKCGCIDYYPINLDNRIGSFQKPPKAGFGEVQYGVDEMHYSKGDD